MKANRIAYNLALLGVIAGFMVISMGAFTRLMDAGLGCPDWPTCYGHVLWPQDKTDIAIANMSYSETPVQTHKTWPEQVHRLMASALGIISLLLFFIALSRSEESSLNKKISVLVGVLFIALIMRIVLAAQWKITAAAMFDFFDIFLIGLTLSVFTVFAWLACKKIKKPMIILPGFIAAFVMLQGLFGMWTVTLKVWPQVVTTHLLAGFSVVSLFYLLALRLQQKPWKIRAQHYQKVLKLQPIALLALLIVFIQIALGGWTTSNYAAVACPDLPTCQSQWWPQMDFSRGFDLTQGIGPNYLGGQMDNAARMAIHISHRIGAVITSLCIIFLALRLLQIKTRETQLMAGSVLSVLTLQVLLGLSNILFHFPIGVAVAHNAVAALLLLILVGLNYRIRTIIHLESDHE
ncbi:MAG: COX15/CtaA family protein [Pseudomonadales bacterium]|nr:COX15/CtaA family protein [Pseudomonadales bacterium]